MQQVIYPFLAEQCQVPVILVYLEGLKDADGMKLINAVSLARRLGKAVIVYKAGRTPTGQKAVMGHTASLAGDFVVARSLLREAGALVAETFDEFEDLAQLACLSHQRTTGEGRFFFMSNAGFESAGMADAVIPGGPVAAPAPDAGLARRLREILVRHGLDSIVDAKNPLDITPMAADAAAIEIAQAVLQSPSVDGLVAAMIPLTPAMKTLPEEGLADSFAAKLGDLAKRSGKIVVFCVAGGSLYEPYVAEARKRGLPVFRSADRAVRALAAFAASR